MDSCTAASAVLFDYLVRSGDQGWGQGEAERLRGLEVECAAERHGKKGGQQHDMKNVSYSCVKDKGGRAISKCTRRRPGSSTARTESAKVSIRTSSLTFSDTVFGLGGLATRGTTRCSADLPQPSAPRR